MNRAFRLLAKLGILFLVTATAVWAEDGTPDYRFSRVGGGVDYEHRTAGGSEEHRLQLTGLAEAHGFQYGEGLYLRYSGNGRLRIGGSGGTDPLAFSLSASGDGRFSLGALPEALRFGECRPFAGGTVIGQTSTDLQEHGPIQAKILGGTSLGGELGLICVMGDVIGMVGGAGGVRFFDRGDGNMVAGWGQADLTLRWYDNITTRVTGEIDGGIRRATASVSVAPEALGGVSIGVEGEVSAINNPAVSARLFPAGPPPGGNTDILGQRVSLTVGGAF